MEGSKYILTFKNVSGLDRVLNYLGFGLDGFYCIIHYHFFNHLLFSELFCIEMHQQPKTVSVYI